tara:strand:- start:80 stop:901 length:822 start_codon:yes stop_codon:yes gene_type:complete
MNFTNKFSGNLNEISNEQVVLSHKDIYRKINNLENSYDVFFLSLKDNNFIWEKYSSKIIPYGIVENINILSVLLDKNSNLILFKTDGSDIVTHKMEMNKEGNFGFWENVTPETNSYLMNQYILSKSLKDIPNHIDLTKEYICQKDSYNTYDPYDIMNDYEPLKGWEHFDINSDNIPSDIDINSDNISSDIDINNKLEDKLEDKFEEMRIDPYDKNWYTKSEFLNYYKGLTEWDCQEPKKVLLREEIYNFTEKYSDLSDKKFIFLFKEYVKTFQ